MKNPLQRAYAEAIESAYLSRRAALRIHGEDKRNRVIALKHAQNWYQHLAVATAIRSFLGRGSPQAKTYDQLPRAGQIILAACAPEPKKEMDPFWQELEARNGKLDVVFTVNGFELDFSVFAKDMDAQFDRATEDAARELLKGRAMAIQEKLRRVEEFIDDNFDELYKES